jgi:hypothetical protein
MPSKKQRAKDTLSVSMRFPKGSSKGDTLAHTLTLGQSFKSVNSLQFSSLSKAKGLPIFSNK